MKRNPTPPYLVGLVIATMTDETVVAGLSSTVEKQFEEIIEPAKQLKRINLQQMADQMRRVSPSFNLEMIRKAFTRTSEDIKETANSTKRIERVQEIISSVLSPSDKTKKLCELYRKGQLPMGTEACYKATRFIANTLYLEDSFLKAEDGKVLRSLFPADQESSIKNLLGIMAEERGIFTRYINQFS